MVRSNGTSAKVIIFPPHDKRGKPIHPLRLGFSESWKTMKTWWDN
jgi:hypothetical protein